MWLSSAFVRRKSFVDPEHLKHLFSRGIPWYAKKNIIKAYRNGDSRKIQDIRVNRNWKIPLGYALIDGLDGNARANLVWEYIIKLKDAGAKCTSVTCDGTN
ncbi:hypothetical protein HPB47_020019 [Ixodes persulcatus]|uniref:Uncharacterized protein n=1 Tax=Ixodes persulcatus TaxID=34615 RepID=A0AC60QGI9_IXOPE|nr:hypothetical protein HPB47_020019 [Ixodes persulcatus]